MKDPILNNSLKLARKGRYGEAITSLEGEIVRYRDSFKFYYILSLACLYTGDFGRAYTYFKSAYDIKSKDINVLLGIAAINLRRGESGRAIDLYLKVLELESKNKTAKKALVVLRKYGGGDELSDWAEGGRIKKLYPPFPKTEINFRKLIVFIFAVSGSIAVLLFVFAKTNKLPFLFTEKEAREGFESSALILEGSAVELGGVYASILTEKQVFEYYENARKFFNAFDDNRARVEINKILQSNASQGVKNKSLLLLHYMNENIPSFNDLKTKFNYKEVAKDIPLYNGCYVIWKGKATNIKEANTETSFDFLIDYEKNILTGIVPVVCHFAAGVNSETPLEVLAKIKIESGSLVLEAVTIHQSVK
jgi:hypothetical protein